MSLPGGYKKLEYIQSSGTQYINTGFVPDQNTRVVMDIQPLNVSQTQMWCAFGARGSTFFELYKASTGNMNLTFLWGSAYSQYFSIDYTTRHTMEINKNTANVDGTNITYTASTFSVGYALYLLADNNAGTANSISSAKLYSCRIYDNGTLVRDFIPCQNASGVVGLWDDGNSTFYANAGTGTFTAGPVAVGTHMVLIDGTAYEIKGGSVMVGGTVYQLTKGRTLIGGTGYDIPFANSNTYKIDYTQLSNDYFRTSLIANGVTYSASQVFEIEKGTPLTLRVQNVGTTSTYCGIYVDGVQTEYVQRPEASFWDDTYTPAGDCTIVAKDTSKYSREYSWYITTT